MLKDDARRRRSAQFLTSSRFRASARAWRGRFARRPSSRTRANPQQDRPARGRPALPGDPADEDSRPGDRLHLADRRGADPQGPAPGGAGRVLRRRHAAAGGLSRQSVSDRGRPGLRRRVAGRTTSRAKRLRELLEESDARTLRQFLITHVQRPGRRRGRQDPRRGRTSARASRPAGSKPAEIDKLHEAMQSVNISEGPDDERAALRQPRAAAIPAGGLRDHADRDGAPTGGPTA